MGTIADKLQNIVDEKTALKDTINYGLPSSEQIDSNTVLADYHKKVFRGYMEALSNPDTLFDALPKKTGTGASITLNDTAEGGLLKLTLGINGLSQDGTPSPTTPQPIRSINGSNVITISNEDGTKTQTATLDLGSYEIGQLGDYSNEIIRETDGTWVFKQEIGRIVLNGSQNITLQSVNSHNIANFLIQIASNYTNMDKYNNMLTNRFEKQSTGISATTTEGYLPTLNSGTNVLGVYLRINSSRARTTSVMNSWLSANNTIVYYVLQNATYTQITGTLRTQLEEIYQGLSSYSPQTNISQTNDDLPFIISAEAIEDITI